MNYDLIFVKGHGKTISMSDRGGVYDVSSNSVMDQDNTVDGIRNCTYRARAALTPLV